MTTQPNTDTVLDLATKPTVSYVPVTPEMAKRWLGKNDGNRNVRTAQVRHYAQQMANGEWTANSDAICFSPTGRLLNGQHRLNAVIQSGCTIVMLIARGMPEEAMANMDTGIPRNGSDYLKWAGEKNTALLASIGKCALIIEDGRIYRDSSAQKVSPAQIAAYIEAHPELRDATTIAQHYKNSIDMTPTAIGVAYWLCPDKREAIHFLESLSSRIGLDSGSPVIALDNRLRLVRSRRVKTSHRDELCMFFRAWNAWRRGRTLRQVQMPAPGDIIPSPI